MGLSELQESHKNWSQRAALFDSVGIPSSVYMPIVQADMKRTMQSGAQPMTNAEAQDEVFAAWKGYNPITKSPRHSGGLLGDLGTVVSNIIPDTAHIITALPRSLADLGKEVVTPSTYPKIAKDLSSLNGNVGQDLRTLASTPLVNLIPGVSDAGALTTAQGRQSLLEHPVTSALDVAGLWGKIGALTAGASLASRAAEAGTEVTDPLLASTPLAAAAKGHLVQAGARVIDRSVLGRLLGERELPQWMADIKTAEQGLGPGQRVARKLLAKAHLDTANLALQTTIAQQNHETQIVVQDRADSEVAPIFGDMMNDAPAMAEYTRKAALGDIESMTPEELDVYNKTSDYQEKLARESAALGAKDEKGVVKPDLVKVPEGWLPRGHKAIKYYNQMLRHEGSRQVRQTKLEAAKEVDRQAQEDLRAGKITPFKATVAARRYVKAQNEHEDFNNKVNGKIAVARASYEKALRKNLPANLHAFRENTYQNLATGVLQDKLKQARTQEVKDLYTKALSDIRNNPAIDLMKALVGKEEAKAIWEDSVTESLALARSDKPQPLYLHTIPLDQALRKNNLKANVAKEFDRQTSQTMKKAMSREGTVYDQYLGMTEQMLNNVERQSMRDTIFPQALVPHMKTHQEIYPIYEKAAVKTLAKGRVISGKTTIPQLATHLMENEWQKFDFSRYGLRRPGTTTRMGDWYLPKDLAKNLESWTQHWSDPVFSSRSYRVGMKIFRTSVLYGPRHFAHVVVGGLMPLAMDSPEAFTHLFNFKESWPVFSSLLHKEPHPNLPHAFRHPMNAKDENEGARIIADRHQAWAHGKWLGENVKRVWEHTGKPLSEGMSNFEDAAQGLYQWAVWVSDRKKGIDPQTALTHARRIVVNLDSLTPFERTVMKQVMPFYAFTRFAAMYLARLPYDHPLRVAMLSQMANQAIQEWGTGLPQTMMSLFFIGNPTSAGNIMTVNLRNMNPFRSVANTFTLGGFLSSLNPAITAPLSMTGLDVLSGTGQMYPEIQYNPASGNLEVVRPSGDWATGIEQVVPEFGVLDGFLGLSDNMRYLRQDDPQAYWRQILNMVNVPFAPSRYNLPQVKGKNALAAFKGAQNALSQYESSGNAAGTINRYNLIPYQGNLYTPQEFEAWWSNLKAQYQEAYPGISPKAVLPTNTNTVNRTLTDLLAQTPEQVQAGQLNETGAA
jgi:hypothetical protein